MLGITIGDRGLAGCRDTQGHPAHPSPLPMGTKTLKMSSVGCYMAFAFQMHLGSGVKVWRRRIAELVSLQRPCKHRGSSLPGQMAEASCSSLENAQVHGQGLSRSCPWFNSSQQSKTSVRQIFCALHAPAHAHDGKAARRRGPSR